MSLLDIDRSEFEKSLIINKDLQDTFNPMGSYSSDHIPTKLVTPIPGFCIKARTKKGDKVFINICHTEDVPRPKGFRIPMSIGNEREVTDKEGKPCAAFDVAINSEFIDGLRTGNEMMMSIIIDAVADKHGLEFKAGFRELKNVKCKGKIQPMNIEQRPPKTHLTKKPLISEIESKPNQTKSSDKKALTPDFNLLKVDKAKEYYASEIDLKNVLSKDEVCLQLNEDRLFLTTSGRVKYELEYHFPEFVNVDECFAEFDKETQILTVIVPLRK